MTWAQKKWCTTVEAYSNCALSFSKDKLIAISGMASMISEGMQCQYLAGLWRKDLEHQLLWKVINALPAIREGGTRGPSWSWASVDGSIEFDRWSGYFYTGIPGDVEWLAQAGEVDIKLVNKDEFGQVSAGSLLLTGPLGVLRFDADGLEPPSIDDDSIIHTRRSLEIHWDSEEMKTQFSKLESPGIWRYCRYGSASGKGHLINRQDVFYMPVRLMNYDLINLDYEAPMLQGLLLLHHGKIRGRFRRVGLFTKSTQFANGKADLAAFINKTKILDPKYFVPEKQNGDYTILIT